MKRFIALIKKIFSQIIGAAEAQYDKKKDPVLLMREAISKLEDERKKILERYTQASEQQTKSKQIVNDNSIKLGDIKTKAKAAKHSNDTKKATFYAQQAVKLQDWLDRYDVNNINLNDYKANLKDIYEDLGFKKDEYELELQLIESSKDMAQFRIEKVKNIDGFDGTSIDDIIKEAREKVENMNISADAHDETYNDLIKPEKENKKEDSSTDTRVQEFLNGL